MSNILYDPCFTTTYCTKVREVKEDSSGFWHALEDTIFFCESGGMGSDEGLIDTHTVLGLKRDKGVLWHLLEVKLQGDVTLSVDHHRRLYQAQVHTAQHIISALVESIYGCQTMAHHVHDEYNDIEFNKDSFTKRQLNELQITLNGLIRDDLDVQILYPLPKEVSMYTTQNMSMHDTVRIVSIGNMSAQPCSCIHVPSLRYIQMIHIVGVEKSTKGCKIHYICGDQLLHTYAKQRGILQASGQLLAQPTDYIEVGILKLQQEIKNIQADNQVLKQRYIDALCASIPIEEGMFQRFNDMDVKTFMGLGRAYKQRNEGLFIFVWHNEVRVQVVVGNRTKSDVIFNEIAQAFQLQGGGNALLCQGGGRYEESMITYILKMIEKMK